MTIANPPYVLQNRTDHPAEAFRRALHAAVPAPGVGGVGDLAVAQNGTPNMSVNVAAGDAFVACYNALDGVYHLFNDGTVNVAVTTAHATLPRRDLVVLRVRDQEQTGASNDAAIVVLAGTPAASPADPAIPADGSYLVLARIAVGAAVTTIVNANLTDLRPFAAALGAPRICTSATRPSTPNQGDTIWETDTKTLLAYSGTAWEDVLATGAWLTYSPNWTAVTTSPVLGNGTISGWYRRVGKTVHFRILLTMGSTTTYGSGGFGFSLPVASIAQPSPIGGAIGNAALYDLSAPTRNFRHVYWAGTNVVRIADDSGALAANTVPWTWANGDQIAIHGTYEAA
jgi:hypothetical protein